MRLLGRLQRGVRKRLLKAFGPAIYGRDNVEKVYDFFRSYSDFRTPAACSRETGLTAKRCAAIKEYLYFAGRLGAYCLEARTPPQKFMRARVRERFPWLEKDALILEVGPGRYPVFPPEDYPNWRGVDKYYRDDAIEFKGANWAKGRYPNDRMAAGSWEDLTGAFAGTGLAGKFDLVVAAHSYEHVFKPIRSLVEAAGMLRSGGGLALFVPDGLADDPTIRGEPTHTLYAVPEMMDEFFRYAGGFRNFTMETFRPNCDCFIAAERS